MTPPDGSTNRSVAGKLTALRNHLRVFGLAETTRAVLAHFGLSHRPAQDQFDSRHDVSTEGEIEVGDSDIPGPARAHAIKYQPTHEKVLADVLARLPGVREETVFVDLGSGKALPHAFHRCWRRPSLSRSPAPYGFVRLRCAGLRLWGRCVVATSSDLWRSS